MDAAVLGAVGGRVRMDNERPSVEDFGVLGGDGMFLRYLRLLSGKKVFAMPVRKVQGGYQWGRTGKVYPTKAQTERQGRAIIASGWREKKG